MIQFLNYCVCEKETGWSPAGKGLTSSLLFVMFNCVLSLSNLGSGVVLACIDS